MGGCDALIREKSQARNTTPATASHLGRTCRETESREMDGYMTKSHKVTFHLKIKKIKNERKKKKVLQKKGSIF